MSNSKRKVSSRRTIRRVFITAILICIIGISSLIFAGWLSSAKKTAEKILGDLSDSIHHQVYTFAHMPDHINEANHIIIEEGILDLAVDAVRDRYFAGFLASQQQQIYSISYATSDGEYYGACRTADGTVHLMKNNADTGGVTWFYSPDDKVSNVQHMAQSGRVDPRASVWYQAAKQAGAPTLSPVYIHSATESPAISAAWPVYSDTGELQGVLGTHLLLKDIGQFLGDTINDYKGHSVIIEKNTGYLVANSMGIRDSSVLGDGTLKRLGIGEIGYSDLQDAFEDFSSQRQLLQTYRGEGGTFFVQTREIQMEGLDWIILSAIPEGLYIENAQSSMMQTGLIILLALLIVYIIFSRITRRIMLPMDDLLQVSGALASGDLKKRVKVVRNDEIGSISRSFNLVADKMEDLINNLESKVNDRTEDLRQLNQELEEKKSQLQLLLDSTAEAIFGIDLQGICTFCNSSCIHLLGYGSADELLGKDMHRQIQHSYPDGSVYPLQESRILRSIQEAKGLVSADEVFWKKDGNAFPVEYRSFPQFIGGQVTGGVITFLDITQRKEKEQAIRYQYYHDQLTGLFNREFYEENRHSMDVPGNLPLSVIYADIDVLKLTNDIFGHGAGDELIRKYTEVLLQSCGEKGVIMRIGGDEFLIFLPNTDSEETAGILAQIREGLRNIRVEAIKCSISLGSDTKTNEGQSLDVVMANAENAMYKDKTMNRQSIDKDVIDTITDVLFSKNEGERRHAEAVKELSIEIGLSMGLSDAEKSKLQRAALLHDIGKITLDADILAKDTLVTLTEEERAKIRQHPVVGYRILNLFDDTLDIAEYIYGHHERWDGKGYPRGLKGEEIPLISRIIVVAETYDRVLHRNDLAPETRKATAFKAIMDGIGKQFDPDIAERFVELIKREGRV